MEEIKEYYFNRSLTKYGYIYFISHIILFIILIIFADQLFFYKPWIIRLSFGFFIFIFLLSIIGNFTSKTKHKLVLESETLITDFAGGTKKVKYNEINKIISIINNKSEIYKVHIFYNNYGFPLQSIKNFNSFVQDLRNKVNPEVKYIERKGILGNKSIFMLIISLIFIPSLFKLADLLISLNNNETFLLMEGILCCIVGLRFALSPTNVYFNHIKTKRIITYILWVIGSLLILFWLLLLFLKDFF